MLNNHLSPHTMRQYVAGQLPDDETEHVVSHLADCERCLEAVDALWAAQPGSSAPAPRLSEQAAARLERRLVRQIQRTNLAGTILSLGTAGFAEVARALIRPLLPNQPPNDPHAKDTGPKRP
ncbi:MAG: zf-HC2 domain-containing protein [Anaerolineales bacterium]|nr:zf-HC2 domain-containing protein [Anaerolineales bacterium]